MRKIVTTVNPRLGHYEPGFMALVSPRSGEKHILSFHPQKDSFLFFKDESYEITKFVEDKYDHYPIVFCNSEDHYDYVPSNVRVVEVNSQDKKTIPPQNAQIFLKPSIADKVGVGLKKLGHKIGKQIVDKLRS